MYMHRISPASLRVRLSVLALAPLVVACGGVPDGDDCLAGDCTRDVAAAVDPGQPGPRRVVRFDLAIPVAGTSTVATTIIAPTDDGTTISTSGGPMPLVVVSPGFNIARTQYAGYATRLASHGFVAVLQTPRSASNHNQYAADTVRLIDWMISPSGTNAARVAGRVDPGRIGVAGHSLGGKISLLVAARDPRVKAVFGIDPVDGGSNPQARTEAARIHLPAGIPIGLLGETVSGSGLFACAPTDRNYLAIYTAAPAPSFAIRFLRAGHTDFVDNRSGCAACLACGRGSAPLTETHDLAVRFTTAYFLWTLAGNTATSSHLIGAGLQPDIDAGRVTLTRK